MNNVEISINNEKKNKNEYIKENIFNITDYNLKGNQVLKISIKGIMQFNEEENITMTNKFIISNAENEIQSNTITYYTSNDNKNDNEKEYTISGCVWIDTNENGRRDENEEVAKGIKINLINAETSEIINTNLMTDDNGKYSVSISKGKYIVIFLYDSSKYGITTYQAEGIEEDFNSDAISKQFNIDGKNTTVGATDIINIADTDINNIDMGLTLKNKFDLELTKTVNKILVQNRAGTKTYNFNDTNLAKVEIAAKNLTGTKVIIEYKIKVKNTGNVAGYVKNIVDYMPTDIEFSSTTNSSWYKQNENLYNTSLADRKIEPGETVETTLVLTKTMTQSNTGLINNTAEISEDYNEQGINDIDSTVNNKNTSEDDMGSADVIVGIKTGVVATYIGVTIISGIIMGIYVYYKRKKTKKITF